MLLQCLLIISAIGDAHHIVANFNHTARRCARLSILHVDVLVKDSFGEI